MGTWFKDLRAGVVTEKELSIAPAPSTPDTTIVEEAVESRSEFTKEAEIVATVSQQRIDRQAEQERMAWRKRQEDEVLKAYMARKRASHAWDSLVSLFWWGIIIATLLGGWWAAPKAIEYGAQLRQNAAPAPASPGFPTDLNQLIPIQGIGGVPIATITVGTVFFLVGFLALTLTSSSRYDW
jgi:hypothetical protein